MERTRTHLLAAACGFFAVASVCLGQALPTPATPEGREVSKAAPPSSPTASQPEASASTVAAPPGTLAAQGAPLVVGVIDTSGSMRKYFGSVQRTADDFIQRTPPRAAVALVAINNEADKSPIYPPERRAEAAKFIAGLRISGRYTDLSRGTDAALALLQEAHHSQAVLVYFTDGQLTVPATFKHRQSFLDLLRREFGERRSNVHVIVVSFGAKQAAAAPPNLPTNIRIIPVESDGDLQQALEGVLAPAVTQHLSVPPAEAAPAAQMTPLATQTSQPDSATVYLVGLLLLSAVTAAALLVRRRRRRPAQEAPDVEWPEPVENILRPDDLARREEEVEPEPVALLDFRSPDVGPYQAGFTRRTALRVTEAVTVGGSEFVGIHLPGLAQPETLRLSFDGAACRVARLRSSVAGNLDAVRLNGEEAPIQFRLAPGDELAVGGFTVSLMIASDEAAAFEPSPPAAVAATPPRNVRGRRMLRATSAKGTYDVRG